MKKSFFFMLLALISVIGMAQPQGFSYQTIVRDNSGNAITNTQVKFRFTIYQDGSSVYVETDTVTTNDFGLVNLVIGQGQVVSGDFSAIDWSGSICSLQVDLDLQDGGGYHNMGTSAFTSVPYAQYAGSTASGVAGHEGELQFNKDNSLGSSVLLNWNDTLGALGIGTHADTGRLVIQAASDAIDSLPLFQVKDKNGKTVFAVYNNSVHVFVDKEAKKRSYGAYKGGFVVSGKNSGAKANNDILVVNADSTRVFTQDEKAGFGVVGVSAKRGTSSPYMHINPDNYFIGTNSGEQITTGTYNSTFGYETGKALTTGESNNFIGYQSGYNNTIGIANNFIGKQAGYSNDSGNYNNFIGRIAGYSNTTGHQNNFMGDRAGNSNTTGSSNVFIGDDAGFQNTVGENNVFLGASTGWLNDSGSSNVFIGVAAGYNNTSGSFNNFIGRMAGLHNTTGKYNNFMGEQAGHTNTTGYSNNFMGYQAGYSNTSGYSNNFMGYQAGYSNTVGQYNNFIGDSAGYSNTEGRYDNFIGYQSGYSNIDGIFNDFIGFQSGYSNTTGRQNSFFGSFSGYRNTTGSFNVFIGTGSGYSSTTGSYNIFIGDDAGEKNTIGESNVFLGLAAGGKNTTGNKNVFIGDVAGDSQTKGEYNAYLGASSAYSLDSGNYNTFIGAMSGLNITSGDSNVTLGSRSGPFTAGTYSNRLYINNIVSDFPLIYGEFDNKILAINGKLGVGTQSPSHKLTINSTDDSLALRLIGPHSVGHGAMLNFGDGDYVYLQEYKDDYLKIHVRHNLFLDVEKVGIGTDSPDKELTVRGDARVTGSIYYGSGSDTYSKPDFVFAPTYKKQYDILKIERYLKRHKHLPWVTAAKDEKNGVNMTRMSFETLEAVENQQLQIIELKKEVELLKQELKRLKRKSK